MLADVQFANLGLILLSSLGTLVRELKRVIEHEPMLSAVPATTSSPAAKTIQPVLGEDMGVKVKRDRDLQDDQTPPAAKAASVKRKAKRSKANAGSIDDLFSTL